MEFYLAVFPTKPDERTVADFFEDNLSNISISNIRELSDVDQSTLLTYINNQSDTGQFKTALATLIKSEILTAQSNYPNFTEEEYLNYTIGLFSSGLGRAYLVLYERLLNREVITKFTGIASLSNADIISEFGDDTVDTPFLDALANYYTAKASEAVKENSQSHTIYLQITFDDTEKLTNATVILTDTNEFTGVNRKYPPQRANQEGYVGFEIFSVRESINMKVTVLAPGEDDPANNLTITPSSITYNGTIDSYVIDATYTPPEEYPSTPITGTNSIESVDLAGFSSAEALIEIESHFDNLRAIRNAGGALNASISWSNATTADLTRIDQYANLELVSSNPANTKVLIDTSITNFRAVAQSDRSAFINQFQTNTSGTISNVDLGRIHTASKTAYAVVSSAVSDTLAKKDSPLQDEDFVNALPKKCSCEDCQSGVSPLAYLAELINYTRGHVTDGSGMVNLSDLVAKLNQQFSELPAACNEVENEICKGRIVIEVLNGYLNNNNYASPTHSYSQAFEDRAANYRLSVYESILVSIGTSYEEIRNARLYSAEEKRSLANRLGIPLEPNGVSQTSLEELLKVDFTNNSENMDLWLEEMFGLRDMFRSPVNNPTTVPTYETWRKEKLRSQWSSLDHPSDIFHGATATYPIIDPDLIGPDDIQDVISVPTPYKIWKNRRNNQDNFIDDSNLLSPTLTNIKGYQGVTALVVLDNLLADDLDSIQEFVANTITYPVEFTEEKNGNTYISVSSTNFAAISNNDTITIENIQKNVTILANNSSSSSIEFYVQDTDLSNTLPNSTTFDIDFNGSNYPSTTVTAISFNFNEQRTEITATLPSAVTIGTNDIAGIITYDRSATVGNLTSNDFVSMLVNMETQAFSYKFENPLPVGLGSSSSSVIVENEDLTALLSSPLEANLIVKGNVSGSLETMDIDNFSYANGNTTIDLTIALSGTPSEIEITVEVTPWDGLDIIADISGTNNLIDKLQSGTAGEIDTAKAKITNEYHLTVESITRLASLYKKYEISRSDYNNVELSADEWYEVRNILLSAVKQIYFPYYTQEEQLTINSIVLSPKQFVKSTTNPLSGLWPMVESADIPLIDPQLINRKELPDYPYGTGSARPAITLYDSAKSDLDSRLSTISGAATFLGSMEEVWGNPISLPSNVSSAKQLRENLYSNNQFLVDQAKNWIKDTYALSQEDFEKIVEIQQKDEDPNPSNQPTQSELNLGYDLLLKSEKLKPNGLYHDWKANENAYSYFELRKAKLPEWKTSAVNRILWERALDKNSSDPIIDPDVINPMDFVTPTQGIAFDTWTTRRAWVDNQLDTVESLWVSTSGTQQVKFEALINAYFGDYTDDFVRLMDNYKVGVDITIPLTHFSIKFFEFKRLHEIDDLISSNTTLLDDEKLEVYHILTAITKRKEFQVWRSEEQKNSITLRPELFRLPILEPTSFPIPSAKNLTPYLATYNQRKDWLDKLEGRIEQYETVEESLKSVVQNAFEDVTEYLIVTFVAELKSKTGYDGPNTSDLNELKEWCNERFLIDVKNNCCQKTNRIAQAIETLQLLIWGLRTDILENDTSSAPFYNWRLYADNFDEEWKWIGSYGSWRSAMFTFLYPENLTAPHLKRDSSPAFEKLIDQTLNNNRFSPQLACKAVAEYNRYFEDVCNLEIKATCHDLVTPPEWSECSGKEKPKGHGGYRTWHFFFAESKTSNKLYWSFVDDSNEKSEAQSYWQEIPGLEDKNNVKLVGAASRQKDFTSMTVHVFFTAQVGNEDHLFFIVYDRKKHEWNEAVNLDWDISVKNTIEQAYNLYLDKIPSTVSGIKSLEEFKDQYFPNELNTRLFKTFIAQDSATFRMPSVYIEMDGFVFERSMNEDFDSWNEVDWALCFMPILQKKRRITKYSEIYEPAELLGVAFLYGYSNKVVITLKRTNSIQVAHRSTDQSWQSVKLTNRLSGLKKFIGLIPINYQLNASVYYNQELFLLYEDYSGIRQVRMTSALDSTLIPANSPLNKVGRIAWVDGGKTTNPWYAVKPGVTRGQGLWSRSIIVQHSTSHLIFNSGNLYSLIPAPSSYRKIESQLSSAQLQSRKSFIKQAYLNNSDNYQGITSMPRHLELVKEAFFFIPMHIGNQLVSSEDYIEALDWMKTVYDYSQEETDFRQNSERKIYYGLIEELSQTNTYKKSANWLLDPLNPHRIAESRTLVYNKYVILSLVQAILTYADSLYTIDTAETIPKARQLYDTALELLKLIKYQPGDCQKKIGSIEITIQDPYWKKVSQVEIDRLSRIRNLELITDVVDGGNGYTGIKNILTNGSLSDEQKAVDIADEVSSALGSIPAPNSIETALENQAGQEAILIEKFLTNSNLDNATQIVRDISVNQFDAGIVNITGYSEATIDGSVTNFNWLKGDGSTIDYALADDKFKGGYPSVMRQNVIYLDPENTREKTYKDDGSLFLSGAFAYGSAWSPAIAFNYCVPPNPIIKALCLKAELNLFKMRNCMNIAGMTREVDPFAAPTDSSTGIPTIGASGNISIPGAIQYKPTPFRYEYLVERAKQLINLAQQAEAAMLASLEKLDQERYSQMKARQDLQVAKAQLKLQHLRVREAESGVSLAELQRERAEINSNGLQNLIQQGLTQYEEAMISEYKQIADMQKIIATSSGVESLAQLYLQYAVATQTADIIEKADPAKKIAIGASYIGAGVAIGARTTAQFYLADAQLNVQTHQIRNSVLRQEQNWQLQKSLSDQDIKIGNQQVKVAENRVKVVAQEREISELQINHAEDTLEFLQNKFTNADLYAWMSKQLERVYSYFLQEATSVAQLAQGQLAYERQEAPAEFIQADYWESPKSFGVQSGETSDRKGLTGSIRLLQDLTKLDQFAFTTEKRRLQLSKTFSLSALFPIQFEELRKSGKMTFHTLMEWFDRDYPGHYHRLIKSVRVSVIALNSPGAGIKATLSNTGLSRVVIGDTFFQSTYVRTQPDEIALSSGVADSGLIELSQDNRMLNPFESIGVDTTWEFRMEKAANPFDYNTLADVLITIDYEALNSFTYRAQVINELNNTIESDLALSFKNNLPDQWYDLANSNNTTSPTRVKFETVEGMLPANASNAKIDQISMFFDYDTDDNSINIDNVKLELDQGTQANALGGVVNPNEGIASTRTGSAAPWVVFIGSDVAQKWAFELNATVCNYIKDEKVNDIILVISYKADTPSYNL